MRQDHRCRVMCQADLDKFARVDRRFGQRAPRDFCGMDQTVLIIQ